MRDQWEDPIGDLNDAVKSGRDQHEMRPDLPDFEPGPTARERLQALFMMKAKESAPKIEYVPNRETLRGKGFNRTQRYGKPFARITSSTRAAPCHLDTYYSIYFKDENGKTVKKVVIRKDMFDKSSVVPYKIQKGRT